VSLKIKILFFYDKITSHFVPSNDILIVIPNLARNLVWIFRVCLNLFFIFWITFYLYL